VVLMYSQVVEVLKIGNVHDTIQRLISSKTNKIPWHVGDDIPKLYSKIVNIYSVMNLTW
jgi:hypothetical protein